MKKLFVLAVVALMTTVSANAQQMFIKPMVGGTLSTVTGDYTDDVKMKIGLAAGAEFGYHLMDQFAITAGALVSMQGAGQKDTDHFRDAKTTTTYLNIPILANYYIVPGLAVKAGIQPGFLLSAKAKGEEYYSNAWHEYDESGTDGYNKFDLSIPLGLSYEISDFVIDARYNLGLSNIIDKDKSIIDAKQKNSVIMLTVGYKIPF
jgi:hypothetical protein